MTAHRQGGAMSAVQLTGDQHRALQTLAERVGRVTQADRLFFERFRHRQYRVRIASQAEIEQDLMLTGSERVLLPGERVFVAIKNVASGVRLRLLFVGPIDADTDLSEAHARLIFEEGTDSDKCREIEAQLRQLAEGLK